MESREDDLRQTANREKRFVALSSLLAAVMLTTFKVVVGLATNSLGILSEAAHSALDLVAAAVTLWAVHISGKPADPSHTYGHGKFENLSALFETLLLLATCVWIIYESVRRLAFAEEVHVHASIWAFVVVGVSIVVDISRSRALWRRQRETPKPGPGGRRPALLLRHLVVGRGVRGTRGGVARTASGLALASASRHRSRVGRRRDRHRDKPTSGEEVGRRSPGHHPCTRLRRR